MAAPNVAIIEAFYPGTRGSEAIAAALFAMPTPSTTAANGAVIGAGGGAAYVDRWGRMPYSIYPASWAGLSPMDEMDLAVTVAKRAALPFGPLTSLQFFAILLCISRNHPLQDLCTCIKRLHRHHPPLPACAQVYPGRTYRYAQTKPLYEFAHGLQLSSFGLTLDPSSMASSRWVRCPTIEMIYR